jgi:flagellar biosynthesis/type III secretory pathway protein FliH
MATIIKPRGSTGENDATRCAAFNLDDIAASANSYLDGVRRQAEEILAQAREEAAQLRRQGAEQGRADALKVAQQQAHAKAQKDIEQRLQTLLPALQAALAGIAQDKAAWRAHWGKRAVELAVAIAQRIARRQFERHPEIALELVRESLELAAGAGRVVLRMNPRDCDAFGDQAKKLAAQAGPTLKVEVVSDPEVSPGGCRVVSEFGEIDQRLESQLARIQEELTD